MRGGASESENFQSQHERAYEVRHIVRLYHLERREVWSEARTLQADLCMEGSMAEHSDTHPAIYLHLDKP